MTSRFRERLLSGAAQALFLSAIVAGDAAAQTSAASGDAGAAASDAAETSVGEVVVLGLRRALQIDAGPLGERTILETPFSVGSVDTEQITRVAATTIDAAFNYDASIRPNNSGVAAGNTFSARGQSVDLTNGYKYDGLAFPYWFQDHPIEAVEQIQVLKGAGGFIYGYASPAGIVNFISKKPTSTPQTSVDLSFRSSNIWRLHLDVGGPFAEGSSTSFRFNAVHEEGKLYNGADNKNQFATLWLQGEITPDLTWSLDGFYQRTWQARQSNNITFGPNVTYLKPVSGTLNLGTLSSTKFNDIAQFTGKLNYRISDDWQASAAFRYSTLDERFPGNTAQITNNAGDVTISLLNQERVFYYYVGQATLQGKFDTGPLEHNLVVGFDYLDVNFDYDYQPFTANGRPTSSSAFGQRANIYTRQITDWGDNPAALAFQRTPDWFRYQEIRQRGIYVSDTVKLGRFELMGGVRYTRYREVNKEPVLADTRYSENSFTPVAAISYDVAEGVRVYASHVEALQRGGTGPDNSLNYGQSYGPLTSKQYEIGLKVQRRNWNATIAAFRTDIPSEFVTAPAPGQTLGRFVRDGERRFEGVEFDSSLQLSDEWLLNLSVAYLDAEQTKAADPRQVGIEVPGAVGWRTAAFVEYSPSYVPGLKVFGGVRYTGEARGQTFNTFKYPASTVGDVGVSYHLPLEGKDLELRAGIQNITNEKYWIANASGTGLSAGAPRTFSLGVGVTTGGFDRWSGSGGGGLDGLSGWYLAGEVGGSKTATSKFDIVSRLNPSLGTVEDGVAVKHKDGWAFAGAIGYDFGLVRGEFEASHQQADLKQVRLSSGAIPIDTSRPAAGTYENPNGTTAVSAFMFNGLFDWGGDEARPWALEGGFGLGLARINSSRWRLQEGVNPAFQADNRTAFAWQALAGVRRRVSDHVDVTVTYRYFNVPKLHLDTTNANDLHGDLKTHSVMAGATYNF